MIFLETPRHPMEGDDVVNVYNFSMIQRINQLAI